MYGFKPLATALALCTLTSAIQVTSPISSTLWSSDTSGQTVSWTAVNTDATSFVIQLVNQAGFLSNSPVTLVGNQSTGSVDTVQSVTVTYPSGAWPTGTAFQINFMSSPEQDGGILAQSHQFNITSGGTTGSTTSGSSTASIPAGTSTGSSTTTISASGSGTVLIATSMASSTGSSGDASGGIPNAATTTSAKSSACSAAVPSLVGLLLSAAGLVGFLL